MSTPPEEPIDSSARRGSRLRLAVRVVAGICSLVALSLLWSTERLQVAHDLQLVSEAVARPGEVLALRALVLRDVDAPSGPTLTRLPVRVELRDPQDHSLAQTTLEPGATDSMEGELRIPANTRGPVFLHARAELADGLPLECTRPIQVSEKAPKLRPLPREAGPLQQLVVGAVRELQAGEAPAPFLPRVLGGACVPEQRCTVVVWVGEPASFVSARASDQISVPPSAVDPRETSGLVSLEIVPHGLDAQLTLEARRAGKLVAERSLRLPVALGEVGVYLRTSLLEPEAVPELSLALPPGRDHAIVDLFDNGRWRASRTVPNASEGASTTLPAEWLPSGHLVRLQARVDRFGSEGSGTRVVFRREPGIGTEATLASLATHVAEETRAPETAGWGRGLPGFALADPQRTAAFLLAPLELLRVPLPAATSGRPARLARLERSKTFLRFAVAALMVLAALVVGTSLMRSGFSAADQASAILQEARAGEGGAGREERLGARFRVILLVLAVGLAFLAGALLIVAKPLWF